MYDDLRGKTALVTGSGQGIGRGIALALAAEGVSVAVNVRNNVAAAEETAAAARRCGVSASVFPVNVADRDGVFAMVEQVVDEFGRIDILVNNAGSSGLKGVSLEDYDVDLFRTMLEEGLIGTLNCCQAVGRHLVRQGSG